MNKKEKYIEEYLEQCYVGARACDDAECMVRISRALVALRADVHEDIFKKEFVEKYYSNL